MSRDPFVHVWRIRKLLLAACCAAALWARPSEARAQISDEILNQVNLALESFQQGRYDEAQQQFTAAVQSARTYQPTADDYMDIAASKFDSGEIDAALEAVEKALQMAPDEAHAHYMRGYILYNRGRAGDLDEAIFAFTRALELQPNHSGAAGELWEIWTERRRFPELIATFKGLVDKAPNDVYLLTYLGRAYKASGSYDKAIESFTAAIAADPKEYSVYDDLFEALVAQGGGKRAITEFQRLAELHPLPPMKWYLAKVYIDDGQVDQAIPILQEIERLDVGEVPVGLLKLVAEQYAAAEQYEDAARVGQRLIELYDESDIEQVKQRVFMMENVGVWLVEADRAEDGLFYLEQAVLGYGTYLTNPPVMAYVYLGQAHHKLGDTQKAEFYFRQYQSHGQQDARILEQLGDIYFESEHNYARAAEYYTEAFKLQRRDRRSPDHVARANEVRYKLALAYYHLGATDPSAYRKCVIEAEPLTGSQEQRHDASVLLAQAFLRDNRPNDAERALRVLEDTDAWDDEAALVMGEVLLAQNKVEEAAEYIRSAREAQPDDPGRMLQYGRLLTMLGQYDEARAVFDGVKGKHRQSVAALAGFGDLELSAAKDLTGEERVAGLQKAVEYFEAARKSAQSDPEIRSRLGDAQGQLAAARAELDAAQDRLVTVFWTLVVVTTILVVGGAAGALIWWNYRRLWKERLLQRVLGLESQLAEVVRQEARTQLGEDWQQVLSSDKELAGRVHFRGLVEKAEATGKSDALGAANFGHLVGILDEKWKAKNLTFAHRARHNTPEMKELIVSSLSYISACRAAHLAHATSGSGRGSGTSHMDRQVRDSLRIVYGNFNLETYFIPEPVPIQAA